MENSEFEADFPSAEAAAEYLNRLIAEMRTWRVVEESELPEPDSLW